MGTKVLIVDDDPGSRELLSEVLAADGYFVSAVADAMAARDELARDGAYDIVIADLRMPNGTGLDLLRDLSSRKRSQDLILMSSFMSTRERQEALELGVRALLEKPFQLSELLQVVGNLANGRPVRLES